SSRRARPARGHVRVAEPRARAASRVDADARGARRIRARCRDEPLLRRRAARERSARRGAAGLLDLPAAQRGPAHGGGRQVGRGDQAARMLMHAGVDVGTLRQREFSRLDANRMAYLDYAGAALYPSSIVKRDAQRLQQRVYGNPHSENAPSRASTSMLEDARAQTLRFFGADPREYDVVFTANASGAIRILAEAFPFGVGS